MVETKKMEQQSNIDVLDQEQINNKLNQICNKLKSIPNIGLHYMEYMAAFIYVMYENRQNLKKMIEIKTENIIDIMYDMDSQLNEFARKEKSKKLFENIIFSKIINKENIIAIKNVIIELGQMIIDVENKNTKGKNIIADAFEYVIMKAAQDDEITFQNTEFYTPKGVVKTMVNLLEIKNNMTVYNPACGTGNFITESAKNAKIYAFGEEENLSNYNICLTNLWLHDIYDKRIKEDDSEELPLFDIAISNPPFKTNTNEIMPSSERLRNIYYKYGIEPKTSNYTKFLVMMLESINSKGKMAIILPHGFLFKKTKTESYIRRKLVEENYIDAIISLPEKLFYNTKIPVIILVINKAKRQNDVLFIDASKEYESKRRTNILTVENQQKIQIVYKKYEEIPNYSYVSKIEEIRKNNYDLSINNYVKIQSKMKDIDVEQLENNIKFLENKREIIQKEIRDLLNNINEE